jgi:hypothetical protein
VATNTYVALDKVTVGSATPSITFTGISQAYTDLVIVANGSTAAASSINMTFNGDTGSNYSYTLLNGSGSSATSSRSSSQTKIQVTDSDGYWTTTAGAGAIIIQVMNYANTTTYKTVLTRSNNAANGVTANVGLWRGSTGSATQAITSVTISGATQNIAAGSTFSLYGILAA